MDLDRNVNMTGEFGLDLGQWQWAVGRQLFIQKSRDGRFAWTAFDTIDSVAHFVAWTTRSGDIFLLLSLSYGTEPIMKDGLIYCVSLSLFSR